MTLGPWKIYYLPNLASTCGEARSHQIFQVGSQGPHPFDEIDLAIFFVVCCNRYCTYSSRPTLELEQTSSSMSDWSSTSSIGAQSSSAMTRKSLSGGQYLLWPAQAWHSMECGGPCGGDWVSEVGECLKRGKDSKLNVLCWLTSFHILCCTDTWLWPV